MRGISPGFEFRWGLLSCGLLSCGLLFWGLMLCGLMLCGSRTASADEVDISLGGGLSATTKDQDFTFRLGGRMQFDAAFIDSDMAEFGSGTQARRVQLALSGVIDTDWYYKVEYGFNDQRMKYAYLRYLGFNTFTMQAGQLNHAFGLEDTTSSNATTFMERSLSSVFAPGLGVGLGVNYAVPGWSTMFCLLGDEINDTKNGDEKLGVSARAVYRPFYDGKTQLLHFAVATSWVNPDDTQTLRFRVRPESALNEIYLVDTDVIEEVDSTTFNGLEEALVLGPWSLQGELMQARVRTISADGSHTDNFSGWYVYGSYFLTGESRNYTISDGEFINVTPAGQRGAWELALRFSHLDLDSRQVHGGEENNTTFAVNWYASRWIRFSANAIQAKSLRQGVSDHPNILEFRTQLVF